MRTIARRLPLLLPASLCAALLLPAGASATISPTEQHQATERAVGYLRSVQQSDGSFPGFGGEWALSALSAAGVAPAGVKSGTTDARSAYRSLIGESATWPGSEPHVTDYEDAALAAYAAGIDPARVSPTQNLIAHILAGYQPSAPGYYGEPGFFNGTAFALLALAETKTRKGAERVPAALLEPSIAAARANQHTDGGWTFFSVAGSTEGLQSPSEAEFTGATIAALCSSGVPTSDPAIVAARSFLAHDLEADGAFAAEFGPNTDTNAWAVQGLDACGISPQGAEFTTASGKTPLDYLASQQLAGGGFRFEASESGANLYSTQDALRALAGGGFTAEPAKAKGEPRWVYEKSFTPGQATSIGLVVDGGGPVSVCSAPVTPASTKTTLGAVLEAAKSSATPSGCVTAFLTGKGGAISSVDGHAGSWMVSADQGKAKAAKLTSAVHIGDTLYLHD
jgi:hypothetical protein